VVLGLVPVGDKVADPFFQIEIRRIVVEVAACGFKNTAPLKQSDCMPHGAFFLVQRVRQLMDVNQILPAIDQHLHNRHAKPSRHVQVQ